TSIAANDTALFWTSGVTEDDGQGTVGKVSSVPAGGGQVSVLADNRVSPWLVSVFGSSVYWFDEGPASVDCTAGPGDLATMPAAGGTVETLATNVSEGFRFAISGETAVLAAGAACNDLSPYTVSKISGGATQVIGQAKLIGSIVADGTHVYDDGTTTTDETETIVRELE